MVAVWVLSRRRFLMIIEYWVERYTIRTNYGSRFEYKRKYKSMDEALEYIEQVTTVDKYAVFTVKTIYKSSPNRKIT